MPSSFQAPLMRVARLRGQPALLKVKDSTSRSHPSGPRQGGKIVELPIGFEHLISDLEMHLSTRGLDEYLLYPKHDVRCPMTNAAIHDWFKRWLKRAGLPAS